MPNSAKAWETRWRSENKGKWTIETRRKHTNFGVLYDALGRVPSGEERRWHRLYGIVGQDEWDKLLEKGNGWCWLCSSTKKPRDGRRLGVDHCHATGRVRGLLCGTCNQMIGNVEKVGIEKIVNYLRGGLS